MSIGINWKEIWEPVWKLVWRQAVTDGLAPRGRRPFRSRITRHKPVQPKPARQKRHKRVQRILPPIVIPPPIAAIAPPTALERYAENLTSSPPIEGVLLASLSGCTLKMAGEVGNSGRIMATLDAPELEMTLKAQVYDDAVSIYLGMPELEPELVDA